MIELIAIATLLSAAFAQDSRGRARRSYVEAVLRRHTEAWLDQMQERGWYPPGSKTRSFERPTEWDINCGDCEDWAVGARKLLGGQEVWLEELIDLEPEDLCHCVLLLDGRYYDSQHPDGVTNIEALDLVQKVSRHDYLRRRQLEERRCPSAMEIPEEVSTEYSYGKCMWLALALHERYGWPIWCQFDVLPDGEEYIAHAYVVMPDGREVDILGPQNEVDLFSSGPPRQVSPDYIRSLADSDAELMTAMSEANEVMRKYVSPCVESNLPTYATDRLIGIYDYYEPNVRALQHAFKDGDPLALERMCAEMAPFVPTDAVLVAMPDRTGRPTATLSLVKCLAHVTRRPWSEALVGNPRESLRELKHQGKELPELKFWLLGGLPKGRPVVIDNVLDTGTTARAALAAVPNATVLSHAVVTQQIGASLPSPQPAGPWKILPDGRLLGYRAWRYDPDTNEAISGADSRQRAPLSKGIVHRLSGKGMFLASSRQYVLDYYAGNELNAICRYAFEPSSVTSGSLTDREPEISVREAELLGYDVVDGDGEPWVRRRR